MVVAVPPKYLYNTPGLVRGEGAYIPPALRVSQKKGGPTSGTGNRTEKVGSVA